MWLGLQVFSDVCYSPFNVFVLLWVYHIWLSACLGPMDQGLEVTLGDFIGGVPWTFRAQ